MRLPTAIELTGRCLFPAMLSWGLGGCSEALRLADVDIDDCVVKRDLIDACWEYGPGDGAWLRNPKRERLLLEGVFSGIGDEEASLLSGLRVGNLESRDAGVSEDAERTGGGGVLA